MPHKTHEMHKAKQEQHANYLTLPHSNNRANFDIVKGIITERILEKKQDVHTHMPRISQSSLRFEYPINPNITTYTFPILENEMVNAVPAFPEEIRLNINDLFFMSDVGIFIKMDIVTEAKAYMYKSSFLLPYSPFELAPDFYWAMENLWNGRMEILVDKKNQLDNYDLMKHKRVPQTQFASYKDVVAQPPAGYSAATLPSLDYKTDGFNEMQPMIELSGSKKNDINLILPNPITLLGAAFPFIAYTSPAIFATGVGNVVQMQLSNLVFITRGLLVQNFSKFQGA